jgi:hypothetical protein
MTYKLEKSKRKNKKYVAIFDNGKSIHFGARGYDQYRDSTGIGAYSSRDHGDHQRRRSYFLRHSGVDKKTKAIKNEMKKSRGRITAKILSHKYLW